MIILDTDSLSLLERKIGAEFFRLSAKLAELSPDEIATTIINFEEQMRGWMAFISKANSIEKQISAYEKLNRFLENYRYIPILQFDVKCRKNFSTSQKLKDQSRHNGFENRFDCHFTKRAFGFKKSFRF